MSGLVKRVKRVGVGRKPTGLYPQLSRVELAELTGETSTAIGQFLLGKARMSAEVYCVIAPIAGITAPHMVEDWSRLHDEWLKRRRENYKFKTRTGLYPNWTAVREKLLEQRRQNDRLKTKTEKRTQGQNT